MEVAMTSTNLAHRGDESEADTYEAEAERWSLPGSHVCRYETIGGWQDGVYTARDLCMRCGAPAPEPPAEAAPR